MSTENDNAPPPSDDDFAPSHSDAPVPDNVVQLPKPRAKKPYLNDIEPVVEQVRKYVEERELVTFCPGGSTFTVIEEISEEPIAIKNVQLANLIRYAGSYPWTLPNEQERVLTAVEVYARRQRADAIHSQRTHLRLDIKRRESRGNTNLEPLRYIMQRIVREDARNDPKAFEQCVLMTAHFMQNTLRRFMNLRDRHVVAPILHGIVTGTGKTEFMRKFFQPAFGPFYFESAFDKLFEQFGWRPWNQYYVLGADEMSVSRKDREVEIAEIKRTMSCEKLSNRGMQSEYAPNPRRNASLFGTSNPHPSTIVGDENNRRFYPIPFTDIPYDELKHNLVDDITPIKVIDAWRGIDPYIPSYAAGIRGEVREFQAAAMHKDDWVDEALKSGLRKTDPNLRILLKDVTRSVKAYREDHDIRQRVPGREDLAERLRTVYRAKCERSGSGGEWELHGYVLTE